MRTFTGLFFLYLSVYTYAAEVANVVLPLLDGSSNSYERPVEKLVTYTGHSNCTAGSATTRHFTYIDGQLTRVTPENDAVVCDLAQFFQDSHLQHSANPEDIEKRWALLSFTIAIENGALVAGLSVSLAALGAVAVVGAALAYFWYKSTSQNSAEGETPVGSKRDLQSLSSPQRESWDLIRRQSKMAIVCYTDGDESEQAVVMANQDQITDASTQCVQMAEDMLADTDLAPCTFTFMGDDNTSHVAKAAIASSDYPNEFSDECVIS